MVGALSLHHQSIVSAGWPTSSPNQSNRWLGLYKSTHPIGVSQPTAVAPGEPGLCYEAGHFDRHRPFLREHDTIPRSSPGILL